MTMYKELHSLKIRCEKWAESLSSIFQLNGNTLVMEYIITTGLGNGRVANKTIFSYSHNLAVEVDNILDTIKDIININQQERIKYNIKNIKDNCNIIDPKNHTDNWGRVLRIQLMFNIIKSEIYSILDSFDVEIQRSLLVERAFEYIQAMIVASDTTWCDWVQFDPTTNKPQIANEITCERLGAASLLLSGIWAVKVGTTGKITDLFLPLNEEEHEVDVSHALRTGSFFVLTEWKVATSEDFKDKVRQAQSQADIYKGDSLGSFQVNGKTYLVICTLECLTHLALEMESELNEEFGEGRYRVINLYASTDSASVISKAQAAHKKRQILTIKKQDKSKT